MLTSIAESLPKKAVHVIANNDVVYLWWSFPQKIEECLGYSIHRIVDGKEKPLRAYVGFDRDDDPRKTPQNTDIWPIQSFNWKDLFAPSNKDIRYKIVPMVGTWDNLQPLSDQSIMSDPVRRTQQYGDLKIIFNRGFLSTQAVSRSTDGDGADRGSMETAIKTVGSVWRKRLAGQMLDNFHEFFKLAPTYGGKYYASLYELTDFELIENLTAHHGNEIILSNANSTILVQVEGQKKSKVVIDGTNDEVRAALHLKMDKGKVQVYDRMLGTHIGHNKFVIYVNNENEPRAVLTGSTNWTATGLCGQTNNLVIIDNPELAAKYYEYWQVLKADNLQDGPLRQWCKSNSFESTTAHNSYKVWFSPNTLQKNKPANAGIRIDMQEVSKMISKAKKSILFLVFNPGTPSILEMIKEVAKARVDSDPLFVRGAISDAKLAKKVVTQIFSTDATEKPNKYVVGDEQITGVAAIPGTFSYWEKELLKLGFATIHDKLMVIDPFDDDCVVITGSHNLGYKASYTNDENMLFIKGNKSVAQAYATHVLDVVNHFKWRYLLQASMKKEMTEEQKRAILKKKWNDLDESDKWQDHYYGSDGFINQYRLFLR
jgi:phosphatidylserine/phosphatidylglycerophosphate/cardiolipin synthase-like enzyme